MSPASPIRTCVGCGRKAPQAELVRYVAPEGELRRDASGREPGRGAYACPRPSCFERAVARRAFSRALRRTVAVPHGLKTFTEGG